VRTVTIANGAATTGAPCASSQNPAAEPGGHLKLYQKNADWKNKTLDPQIDEQEKILSAQ